MLQGEKENRNMLFRNYSKFHIKHLLTVSTIKNIFSCSFVFAFIRFIKGNRFNEAAFSSNYFQESSITFKSCGGNLIVCFRSYCVCH